MRPPEKFPWGQIIEEWEIGPYRIAKYHPYKTPRVGLPHLPRAAETDRTEYHIWVDGKDTHTGALTLEGALLLAIATKSLGSHPEGMSMIARALKIGEETNGETSL